MTRFNWPNNGLWPMSLNHARIAIYCVAQLEAPVPVADKYTADGMGFMAEFQPIPNRPLLSLVEILLAWRKAHPHETKFQMVFIGDSVTGQMFTAALCELARNSKVKSLTYDATSTKLLNVTSWRHNLIFQESHIKLEHEEAVDFCLLYVRQHQLTSNAKAVELFHHEADVILVGWGLHYEKERKLFPPALDLAFSTLHKMHQEKKRTVVWFGALQQHFRFDANNDQVDGLHKHGKFPTKFCGPVARFPSDHTTQVQSINRLAFDYITTKLNVSASWFRWNNHSINGADVGLHVHFLPYTELPAPFYRNHREYNANSSVKAIDCTHLCSAPNLDEPIWDALYMIVHGTATPMNQTARHPSGTRRFPPIVKWNKTYYSSLLHNLQGEVL